MRNRKLINLYIIALSIALMVSFSFAGIAFADNANTAAVYGTQEASSLWYYGSNFLNISAAKETISTWDANALNNAGIIYIGVIDTGIDTAHEIFDGVLAKNSKGDVLGYNSYAAYVNDDSNIGNISDVSSKHGTEVAGIMAMLIKELGLQDHIKLYPIKANTMGATKDSFKVESVIKAIEWASSESINLDVINMSLGILGADSKEWSTSKALEYAISQAAKKAVVVSAAGNNATEALDSNTSFYPAAINGVVSVVGYDRDKSLYHKSSSSGSNYGNCYDIACPAIDIYTASGYTPITGTSSYNTVDGTSMATPMVSVAAALLKLRLIVEGTNRANINGNGLSRMLNNLNSAKINKASYTYPTLDFNTLLTQDFNSTEYNYLNPTALYLAYPQTYYDDEFECIYMMADDVKDQVFEATIIPYGETNPDLDNAVEWYVIYSNTSKELIGKGLSLTYSPKRPGSYQVGCKLVYDKLVFEDYVNWYIESLPYIPTDVRVTFAKDALLDVSEAPTEGKSYTTETVSFGLTGVQYVDKSVDIKWYVNGEYVTSGETFDFVTKKAGTYVIACQFGAEAITKSQYSFTLNVSPIVTKPVYMALIIVAGVLACGGIVTVVVLLCKKMKLRKLTPQEYKYESNNETEQSSVNAEEIQEEEPVEEEIQEEINDET